MKFGLNQIPVNSYNSFVILQSACSLDRISAMLPRLSASMNREDGLNNASENATVVTEKPPIIDNLRNFSAHEWYVYKILSGYGKFYIFYRT